MGQSKCLNTVEVNGRVIARFASSTDAAFFAHAANEAGLFSMTNPGVSAVAYNYKGDQLS